MCRAFGYQLGLVQRLDLEEQDYLHDLHLNDGTSGWMGRRCPASGMMWKKNAAWKLAPEGPHRIRQLVLGPDNGGRGNSDRYGGCVVPFDWLTIGGGGGKGSKERTPLSLCLKASHLAPRIAHVANRASTAITRGTTSAAMRHPLINFVRDSIAVDLLFDEYYGIDDDGNAHFWLVRG